MAAPLIKSLINQSLISNIAKQTSSIVGTRYFPTTTSDPNLPPKPKRPFSSWIAFVRDRKDDVLRQRQNMTADVLANILAKEWKTIDRSQYDEEYKKRLDQYKQSMIDYDNSLTLEQKAVLKSQTELANRNKAIKELKKTKPPKMPRNAANFYCLEKFQEADIQEQLKTRKSAQIFSDLFKEYKILSESQKEKYLSMQQQDKERFKREFLEWFEVVNSNEKISRAARNQAQLMKSRFESLNYI